MNWRAAAALAAACVLGAGAARAHVIYGTDTLRGLVAQSDAVVRVRILDPGSPGAGSAQGEPVVVAEVLTWLERAPVPGAAAAPAGAPPAAPEKLRFVQHGHGVPVYEKQQEAVIFLRRIERSRELAGLASEVAWVSLQEGPPLAGSEAELAALRAYVALEKLPLAQHPAGLREITLKLLASPDPKLASSAVRDVALLANAPIVTAEDVPALEKLLVSQQTPIGVRITLLSELERRQLVSGPPQWVKLLREARGADRIAVVRALASHPSAAVTHELVALLANPDGLLVSSAAISLGVPGNEKAVEPLAKLLGSSDPRVRNAAIRGLGRIGTPAAEASLAHAAASHPDADTRRRAGAAAPRQP